MRLIQCIVIDWIFLIIFVLKDLSLWYLNQLFRSNLEKNCDLIIFIFMSQRWHLLFVQVPLHCCSISCFLRAYNLTLILCHYWDYAARIWPLNLKLTIFWWFNIPLGHYFTNFVNCTFSCKWPICQINLNWNRNLPGCKVA